jgi:hydroxyacylglutathione hydrolase
VASPPLPAFIVETFPVGPLQCNCTVLGDPATHEAIVVDPGDDFEKVTAVLARHGLQCRAIVNTHTHIDHVGGNDALREATGAKVMLHEADLPLYDNLPVQAEFLGLYGAPRRSPVDEHIHQGDRVRAGGLELEVLHTPGHTPGSLCFHLAGAPTPLLFSGDTLFAGSIGRTDLWGGDYDQEIASIRARLFPLDDRTRVIAGHGLATTIGYERRRNPYLSGR